MPSLPPRHHAPPRPRDGQPRAALLTLVVTLAMLGACSRPSQRPTPTSSSPAPRASDHDAQPKGGQASPSPSPHDTPSTGETGRQPTPRPVAKTRSGDTRRERDSAAPLSGDPGASDTPPNGGPDDGTRVSKTRTGGSSYGVQVLAATGLSSDDVARALRGAAAKTDACYADLKKSRPDAAGKTTLELTITPKKPVVTRVVSDETLSADLTRCLESTLKDLDWPAAPGAGSAKATVEYFVERS